MCHLIHLTSRLYQIRSPPLFNKFLKHQKYLIPVFIKYWRLNNLSVENLGPVSGLCCLKENKDLKDIRMLFICHVCFFGLPLVQFKLWCAGCSSWGQGLDRKWSNDQIKPLKGLEKFWKTSDRGHLKKFYKCAAI